MDSDKQIINIAIVRGVASVSPVFIASEGAIYVQNAGKGLRLRLGKDGCRIDVDVGINLDEMKHDGVSYKEMGQSSRSPFPSFSIVANKETPSNCIDAKIAIRTYLGYVSIQDDYRPPDGRARSLGLRRKYGREGCNIEVGVSKAD
jgi:hypothetical protein